MNKLTPEEFTRKYYEKIKTDLNLKDISVNKLGFFGFFMHVLGNFNYDIQQYYDYLFKESFPVTATDYNNLIFHANLYNYLFEYSSASEIIGEFEFNLYAIPNLTSDLYKREIIINDLHFFVGDKKLNYKLDAKYKIVYDKISSLSFKITSEITYNNNIDFIPLNANRSRVKIIGCRQYDKKIEIFKLPTYTKGTFYSKNIKVLENISNIKVFVNEEEYQVLFSKNLYDSRNKKVVFINIYPNKSVTISFGSGDIGEYLPNTNIRAEIEITLGELGNIGSLIIDKTESKVTVRDFNARFELINTQNINVNNFVKINIEKAVNGRSINIDEDFRKKLVNYISTRENLLTENDFYKILQSKKFVLFKKSHVAENTIYNYFYLVDKINFPVKTTTMNLPLSHFPKNRWIYEPEFTINNDKFICPFLIKYNPKMKWYDCVHVDNNKVIYPNTILLDDTPVSIFLNIEFNLTFVRIKVKSIFNIDNYRVYISINEKDKIECEYYGGYYVLDVTSLTFNDIQIKVFLENIITSEIVYTSIFKNVNIYHEYEIKFLVFNNEMLLSVPLIEKASFYKDRLYYIEKIKNKLDELMSKKNRLISDDLQIRFCDTYMIQKKFTNEISNDLFLPLKLKIRLYIKNEFKDKVEDIRDELELKLVAYLVNVIEQEEIEIYKAEIINLIQDFGEIKNSEVFFYDFKDTELDFIIIPNKNKVINDFTKEQYLEYVPSYIYFDINNILIEVDLI